MYSKCVRSERGLQEKESAEGSLSHEINVLLSSLFYMLVLSDSWEAKTERGRRWGRHKGSWTLPVVAFFFSPRKTNHLRQLVVGREPKTSKYNPSCYAFVLLSLYSLQLFYPYSANINQLVCCSCQHPWSQCTEPDHCKLIVDYMV